MRGAARTLVVLLLPLLIACSPSKQEQKNIEVGYNFAALDRFISDHLGPNFATYLTKQEARDIAAGRGKREYIDESWVKGWAITYESQDLQVFYWPAFQAPNVWNMRLGASRLPEHLKTRQDFMKAFAVQPQKMEGNEVQLYGECRKLSVYFQEENIQALDFWYDFGCI